MAYIDIDIDDYLHDASKIALREEIKRRAAAGKWEEDAPVEKHVEVWTAEGMAADIRNAYYARNASRLELLLTILEKHEAAQD